MQIFVVIKGAYAIQALSSVEHNHLIVDGYCA
jgi:hypothetical protein